MIALETNEGFPSEIKERGGDGSNQPHTAISFASPVDVKSIIMHSFIVLLLCQCMNSLVYREKISLPPLSPSHPLSFSVFPLSYI